MGWLMALGLVALLLFMPLGIGAHYDETGGGAWLNAGPVKFILFPKKSKIKERKQKSSPRTNKGGHYTDFLPLLESVLELFADLRHKLIVSRLRCRLILADGDPCDLGVNYGRAWAAMGSLTALLEQLFVIKKRDLSVECDFTADKTRIMFHIQGRISVFRLLSILAVHGTSILKKYHTIINQRKGGVNI